MSPLPGAFAVVLLLFAIIAAVASIRDVIRERKAERERLKLMEESLDRDRRRAFKEAKRIGLLDNFNTGEKSMNRLTNNQTEYFNQLAEEFNAPDVEDKGDLPAVEAEPVAPVTPVIREPFTPLDSYGLRPTERSPHVVHGVHAQSDTAQNAPVLTVKQAG